MNQFTCINCHKLVNDSPIGTKQRNHCPFCLYSLHVDDKLPGDRKSNCHGQLKPIALAFKKEKPDKFSGKKLGELMIVHQCQKCQKIVANRISGDDDTEILNIIYQNSIADKLNFINNTNIKIADTNDKQEVKRQLEGN